VANSHQPPNFHQVKHSAIVRRGRSIIAIGIAGLHGATTKLAKVD
jgi:hypothetical protein